MCQFRLKQFLMHKYSGAPHYPYLIVCPDVYNADLQSVYIVQKRLLFYQLLGILDHSFKPIFKHPCPQVS